MFALGEVIEKVHTYFKEEAPSSNDVITFRWQIHKANVILCIVMCQHIFRGRKKASVQIGDE